jgi:adenylate cyclase
MADGASKLHNWIAELRRRKVFRAAAMYLVIAWLLIQVAGTTFEPMGLPAWTLKLTIALAVLGFPLVCGLAWALDLTPQGIDRVGVAQPERAVSPAGGADASSLGAELAAEPAHTPTAVPAESVAILPFADMSPAHDQEYFCDGIAEEIINALCCVRSLRVASRTSSFQFKGRSADVGEIGRQLRVGAVLAGSVRKSGERVRIAAQLINSADGFNLWSETYDRDLEDTFAIQTEIAQRLTKALQLSLSPRETRLLERGGTRNVEAYDLYLRGQQMLRRYSESTAEQAAVLFRDAIGHDAGFAQAHAALGSALAIMGQWRTDMSAVQVDEAVAAIENALAIEPWTPEAFTARACLMSMQGRAADAARDFDEAIRLNPAAYFTYYLYGRHCMSTAELDKAVQLFRTAARLEPEAYTPLGMLASALQRLGRRDEWLEVARQGLQSVERHLQLNPTDSTAMGRGAIFAAWLGDGTRAAEFVERAMSVRPDDYSLAYNAACTFAQLGNAERALTLLEQSISHGHGNLGWLERDSDLDSLRGEPRFVALVSRLRNTPN